MKKVDLHIHTINSDGSFSTREVLKMCEERDLKIISITDHDSLKSYYDIKEQGLSFNGNIINGVELSFAKDGRIYDILGYAFDIEIMNKWLVERYKQENLIAHQKQIFDDMKKLYKKLGIKFDESLEVKTGKKAEAYNLIKQSALTFEENKLVAPELFGEMFYKKHHTNKQSKYYVDETSTYPSLEECINIIKKAGGVSSLAHSGAYGFSLEEMENYIMFAIESGVQGLELKYNCHTPEQETLIAKIAEKYDLLMTGGSDFHGGKIKPQVKLGRVFGEKEICDSDLEKFMKKVDSLSGKRIVNR